VPTLVAAGGWRLPIGLLGIGPVIGTLAMWRLHSVTRRRPEIGSTLVGDTGIEPVTSPV
jgi:hypothetical protein